MVTDKMKEWREWATFALSFATVIAIPIGLLILRNQRLEILSDVASKYVNADTYKAGMAAQAENFGQRLAVQADSLGQIKGKLDSMFIEQIHMSDNFQTLREKIDNRGKP